MTKQWPPDVPVIQVRIARATNHPDEIRKFYHEGLGLPIIMSFEEDPFGYSGVVFGLPGYEYHMEFCSHADGFPSCSPPTEDNLLVFYLSDSAAVESIAERLKSMGYHSVPAKNVHWDRNGITFEDPDGWRVVLMGQVNVG